MSKNGIVLTILTLLLMAGAIVLLEVLKSSAVGAIREVVKV